MAIAYTSKCLDYTVYGKSEQETSTGKNLLQLTPGFNRTYSGMIVTVNSDGSITFNGTCTANNELFSCINLTDDLINKNCTLSVYYIGGTCTKGTSENSPLIRLYDEYWGYNLSINKLFELNPNNKLKYITYTSTPFTAVNNNFRFDEGVVCNNFTIKVMLTADIDTKYQPYTGGQPAPSPDYPQEIKTIPSVVNLYDLSDTYETGTGYSVRNNIISFDWSNTTTSNTHYQSYFTKPSKILKLSTAYYLYVEILEASGTGTFAFVSNSTSNNLAQFATNVSYNINSLTKGQIISVPITTRDTFSSSLSMTRTIATLSPGQSCKLSYKMAIYESPAQYYVPYGHYLRIDDEPKNLFNKYGSFNAGSGSSTTSLQPDGTILTTANRWSTWSKGQLINNLKQNTDYTISGILISANGTNKINAIIDIATGNDTWVKEFDISSSVPKPYNFKYTFNSGDNTSIIVKFSGSNNSGTGSTITIFDKIQLEEGSEATSYSPYFESKTYFIDLAKKNLFDKNNTNIIPTYIDSSTGKLTHNDDSCRSIYIPIKSDTTYTVSKIPTARFGVGVCAEVPTPNIICSKYKHANPYVDTPLTISGDSSSKYLVVWLYNSNISTTPTLDETLNSLKIYEGPYTSEDHYELCSIGDVRDELIVENGYADVNKNIGKYTFTGNEGWRVAGEAGAGYYGYYASLSGSGVYVLGKANPPVICTHFKQLPHGSGKTENGFMLGYDSGGDVHNIIFITDSISTADEFKTWLSQNNVSIYYPLKQPYTADIGQVDFPTFSGEIKGIAYNGKEIKGIAYDGKVIFEADSAW